MRIVFLDETFAKLLALLEAGWHFYRKTEAERPSTSRISVLFHNPFQKQTPVPSLQANLSPSTRALPIVMLLQDAFENCLYNWEGGELTTRRQVWSI